MKRTAIVILCLLSIASNSAPAADKNGNFMMGGGVGGLRCPSFLNEMTSAREAGGVHSTEGVNHVAPWLAWVEGFSTGYNYKAPGVFSIFAPLEEGPDAGFAVLFAIEPWCRDHPSAKFSEAVLALANQMHNKQ